MTKERKAKAVNIYTNRPANRISRQARAAERRITFAAIMLTFSIIVSLATIKRIVDEHKKSDLSNAAALAYAVVASPESTSGDETSAAGGDGFSVTDIIA